MRDKLKQALSHLEHYLNENPYFVAEHPTLADISILANIVQILNVFGEFGNLPDLPNINAWFERCSTLPGYEEMLEGGKLVSQQLKKMGIQIAPLK